MTAPHLIHEGGRVRSISTHRIGTVDSIRRRGTPDAFALVRWDDGRAATIGLACLEPWHALAGDPEPRPWAHGISARVQK